MVEVEAQTLGVYIGAFLFDVRSQDLAQCPVQNMGCGMVALDCPAAV
ncbi:unknown [Coraliomargarita sp. CAG:312]|nr:unknown [Coraliomargarita sp. CAG:312]